MKDLIFFSIILILSFTDPVFAYLDPGTGSFILQILIAAFATSVLFIKQIIINIKFFFKKIFSTKKDDKDKHN